MLTLLRMIHAVFDRDARSRHDAIGARLAASANAMRVAAPPSIRTRTLAALDRGTRVAAPSPPLPRLTLAIAGLGLATMLGVSGLVLDARDARPERDTRTAHLAPDLDERLGRAVARYEALAEEWGGLPLAGEASDLLQDARTAADRVLARVPRWPAPGKPGPS